MDDTDNIAQASDLAAGATRAHRRIVLDVHTHHAPPQPEGIVAAEPSALPPAEAFPHQFYSVGFHPWNLSGIALTAEQLAQLREAASRADVLAVGETGVDKAHPGAAPMAAQLNAFRAHAELSEELRKPLVIHCVKGQDMIIGVKRQMKPRQPWIVHGFRGKPSVMRMLAAEGIYLSFGAAFNADSLREMPPELLLAETDEAPLRIQDVIAALSAARADVTPDLIAANTRRIFPKLRP